MKKFYKILFLYILFPLCIIGCTIFGTISVENKINPPEASAEIVVKEEFEKQIAELKENAVVIKAELDKAKTDLSSTQNSLNQANVDIENLTTQKEKLESDLATTNQNLENATNENQKLQTEIENNNSKILELQNNVSELEAQLEESSENHEQLQAEIDENKANISNLQNKVSELQSQLTENTNTISNLQTHINSINESISGITSDINTLSGQITNLSERFDSLGILINDNEVSLVAIEQRISTLESTVANIKAGTIFDYYFDNKVPGENDFSCSYVAFRNGLLIQWGKTVVAASGDLKGSFYVGLRKAYSSSEYTILLTPVLKGKDDAVDWSARVEGIYSDAFRGYATSVVGGKVYLAGDATIYWFTLGQTGDAHASI